jgi:6-pyruvoyl-tetrahydropterin synthase
MRASPKIFPSWIITAQSAFAEISEALAPVFEQLDHRYLNEVAGLENPTSEVLAQWIWAHLRLALPGLTRITVHETCTSGCEYRGLFMDAGRRSRSGPGSIRICAYFSQ